MTNITYYDTDWYNEDIIKLRKKRWKLRRITQYLIDKLPIWDDILLLTHVCNVLQENNLMFTRSELKTCFRKWFKLEFHAIEQKKYLFSICVNSMFDVRNKLAYIDQKQEENKQNNTLFGVINSSEGKTMAENI